MSLLTSLVAHAGVNPFPFSETIPFWFSVAGSNVGTANNLIAVEAPCLPAPLTITYLTCYVVATGGNVRLGAWTFDGTTWTLVAYTASTAVAANSTKQKVAVATPVVIPGGVRRFYGLAADGTTATFGRPPAGLPAIYDDAHTAILKASSFDLAASAASFTVADLGITAAQAFWIRASAT